VNRTVREITDIGEIESILNEASVCRIGLADGNEPYIVPVCFGYSAGKIYLHSALSGKKIMMLEKNPQCCFEVDLYESIIHSEKACAWGVRYKSVIGFGRAHIVSENKEKQQGLNYIICHYGSGMHEFSDEDLINVCVIRINIDSMTGKKNE
jgi:uncharacterized protein